MTSMPDMTQKPNEVLSIRENQYIPYGPGNASDLNKRYAAVLSTTGSREGLFKTSIATERPVDPKLKESKERGREI